MRRRRSTTWRQAKETLVARRSVEVGPGVKMDWKRSAMNADMLVILDNLQVLFIPSRSVAVAVVGLCAICINISEDSMLEIEMRFY